MNTSTIKTTFKLLGLTCVACTKVTAKRIKQIPGVQEALVNLETGIAEITADREIVKEEVTEVLKETKYTVV